MKKLLFAIFILFFSNCGDYLEEENKTDVFSDELYRTASGYEGLVSSAYAALRTVYVDPWMFMSGTDLYVEGRDAQPEGMKDYRNLTPASETVRNFYRDCYIAIQRANIGIFYNDLTEQVDEIQARMGELKFLRAYNYFLLAQSFGGVPLVTEAFSSPATSFERASAEDVYDFIISEMEEALTLVNEDPVFGRVSKRAIRHYLAKIHLTRGYESFAETDDFEKAASYADQAIDNYDLSSISFEDLFWPGNENNAEVLFAIQYDQASLESPTDGSSQANYIGPYHGGEGQTQGYPSRRYSLIGTKYLFDLFTENDLRWEGTFMNVFYERYYDYFDRPAADRPTLMVRYYYPHQWEVADTAAWRAQDPDNRIGTVIRGYSESITPGLITWETEVSRDNFVPAVKKFDDPESDYGQGTSARDIILARLAETYLIAAEAYLNLDDKPTAMARINEVRERAERTPGSLVLSDPSVVTIDLILDERGRELVGEYHRWFDLKRTGKLKERALLYNKDVRALTNPFQGPDGNDKILRPIPQVALDLNENKDVPQNPGYVSGQ